MGILKTLGTGQGYLKAGFVGFPASGKTYTATLLAIGTRRLFDLKGPIAFYDTEGGSEFIAGLVRKETGCDLVGVRARSFDDMVTFGHECVKEGVSVAIVDSVTHAWRELCDAYLKQVNERRGRYAKEKNWKFTPQRNLEFQDWSTVKGLWVDKWTNFYLNSPLHLIICGRAGFEYDREENDDGKKELVKTGIKMRAEGEFGFEPSLLIEMERTQTPDGRSFKLGREATIIKDRFNVIDGKSCINPTFAFFKPHVALLRPDTHAPIDTSIKTDTGADEEGGDAWARERKTRTILCEEIVGELSAAYPSQSAADKKARQDLLHEIFETRSWTAVEGMDSPRLRKGLALVRELLGPRTTQETEQPPADAETGTA